MVSMDDMMAHRSEIEKYIAVQAQSRLDGVCIVFDEGGRRPGFAFWLLLLVVAVVAVVVADYAFGLRSRLHPLLLSWKR